MKNAYLLVICIGLGLASCAQTVFYGTTGKPVARFQGDMPGGANFSYTPAGAISWTAGAVNHSAATLAAGTATAGVVSTAGTAPAIAGIGTLIK